MNDAPREKKMGREALRRSEAKRCGGARDHLRAGLIARRFTFGGALLCFGCFGRDRARDGERWCEAAGVGNVIEALKFHIGHHACAAAILRYAEVIENIADWLARMRPGAMLDACGAECVI